MQRDQEVGKVEEVGALRAQSRRCIDRIPSSSKQRRQQRRDPRRRWDRADGGGEGEVDVGRAAGGGRGPGRDSSGRYKARLSAPEVDEGTCGVGRVSWSLD